MIMEITSVVVGVFYIVVGIEFELCFGELAILFLFFDFKFVFFNFCFFLFFSFLFDRRY